MDFEIISITFLLFVFLKVLNGTPKFEVREGKGNITNRIIGGKPTRTHPWQVSILSMSMMGAQACGGTLISNQHVLTAAHCIFDPYKRQVAPQQIRVRVGSSLFYSGGIQMGVIKHFLHGYMDQLPYFMANDIAILKLSRPVTLGPSVKPICLATSKYPAGTPAIATGFGATRTGGGASNQLMEVSLKISNYGLIPGFIYTSSTYRGTCQGDSGGPLMISKNGR